MSRRQSARHTATIALALVLTTLTILGISIATIEWFGGIAHWQIWMNQNAWVLRLWRIAFYSALAYGWWRMRQHLLKRGFGRPQHQRLRRSEICSVTVILAMELQLLALEPSGALTP